MANDEKQSVLLTGSTGYVGGRLLLLLEEQPIAVRCLVRNPDRLRDHVAESTEIIKGDLLDPNSLASALEGVHTAYYLVHSMGGEADFAAKDRQAAESFAAIAAEKNVQRIIYLGGLGDDREELSPHLRSRQEVGKILRHGKVETIEFRAAVIIGAGSLSFQLIRALTHRLPIMICPRWVSTPTQPIAIDDVLAYLLAALQLPPGESRVFEIGGADVVSYGDMIKEYARQNGLRRLLLPVPVLTPYLSSLWLHLVTPANATVARHLIEGVRNPTVVRDDAALKAFPIKPMGIGEAMKRAQTET